LARRRAVAGSIPINPDSRAATDALLAELRRGGWRSIAWRRFLSVALARSVREAAAHPRAAAELTLGHGVLIAVACGRPWVATSWLLCLTHLGMLGERSSIGPATAITVLRANLPALGRRVGPWLGPVAIATDLADGRLARRLDAETMFGGYADALADAAFWTWFATRYEPNRWFRAAAIVAWAAPVGAVTAASLARGRFVTVPRPRILRPAAALQLVLAVRAYSPAGRTTARGCRSVTGRRVPAEALPAPPHDRDIISTTSRGS
jgi:hypothetical protein